MNPSLSLALDFGTGSGDFACLLSKKFEGVIAFDISDRVIGVARKKYGSISNIKFITTGDVKDTGIQANSVDLILCITVLQSIMDDKKLDETINYFNDVLRKNGFIVALEFASDAESGFDGSASYLRFIRFKDWCSLFEKNGFRLHRSYGFYHPTDMPCHSYSEYRRKLGYSKFKALGLVSKFLNLTWKDKYLNYIAAESTRRGEYDFIWTDKKRSLSKFMVFQK